ncbi:hypothetical protein [Flavobacterium sp. 3HN19-14]|uniref:hypothetical protein n=1 Tax=Flavobacterium sp. 3HN19-14 TaxID=3448133 RepID=UPI003EE360D3
MLGDFLGVDLIANPDLVAEKYFFESAVFYFRSNNLFEMASSVDDAAIKKVRKAVNGGYNGLDEVKFLVKKYYQILKN